MSNEALFDRVRNAIKGMIGNGDWLPQIRRLIYMEDGRSGYVRYQSRKATFDLYWEFGGGDALVLIDVPSVENWTAVTNLPLEQRDGVLRYIARRVVREKCNGGNRYEIGPDCITIYQAAWWWRWFWV